MNWRSEIFRVFKEQNITCVCHVPDAGHLELLQTCEQDKDIKLVTLTTEEEGVGLLSGAWLGGKKGALLMQSSGVGNTINALALPVTCKMPFVTIVSMRGEWGEFIPWQIPMGQGTPTVLEAMGVTNFRANHAEEVYETVDAAVKFAYNNRKPVSVLLSQRLIGAKQFKEE